MVVLVVAIGVILLLPPAQKKTVAPTHTPEFWNTETEISCVTSNNLQTFINRGATMVVKVLVKDEGKPCPSLSLEGKKVQVTISISRISTTFELNGEHTIEGGMLHEGDFVLLVLKDKDEVKFTFTPN